MFSIKYDIFLFVLATWIAFLEVQIEGKNSWASALPCWRADPNSLANKIYSKIIGGGLPLTGYHAVMFSFVFLILHIPFFVNTSWNIEEELKVCSAYFLLAITWDFLYFVWNPHFLVMGNKVNSISSHKTMLLRVFPGDYIVAILVSCFFAVVASKNLKDMKDWFCAFLAMVVFSFLSCIFQIIRKKA